MRNFYLQREASMATFQISKEVSFTYKYGEENGKQFVEGEFFEGDGMTKLGISLKVVQESKQEAIDSISRYAKLIGSDITK
jgi:hypothetical protein